jgi:four helix bundle protein
MAMGSASETEYHLLLSRDLAYLPEHEYQELDRLVNSIKRMLASLIRKVGADN